jgi:hypothetical protein
MQLIVTVQSAHGPRDTEGLARSFQWSILSDQARDVHRHLCTIRSCHETGNHGRSVCLPDAVSNCMYMYLQWPSSKGESTQHARTDLTFRRCHAH